MEWTQQELEELYQQTVKKASVDAAFREKLKQDSKAAMEELAGRELPDGFRLKFIEKDPSFDAASCEYLRSWKEAAERLLPSKALFEINTGAISRGYRSGPYPSEDIISYLSGRGAGLILSSDAHSPEDIAYGFGTYGHLATAEFDPSAKQ